MFEHFLPKYSTWAPYEQAKTVSNFFVFAKKFDSKVCPRSQRLRRHGVGIVNNNADTDKTTRTLSENFEGFSQILKEQSGEKRYLGVFTNPIAII